MLQVTPDGGIDQPVNAVEQLVRAAEAAGAAGVKV
jgi:hypothetical protein